MVIKILCYINLLLVLSFDVFAKIQCEVQGINNFKYVFEIKDELPFTPIDLMTESMVLGAKLLIKNKQVAKNVNVYCSKTNEESNSQGFEQLSTELKNVTVKLDSWQGLFWNCTTTYQSQYEINNIGFTRTSSQVLLEVLRKGLSSVENDEKMFMISCNLNDSNEILLQRSLEAALKANNK